ncbi:uncharacterized protein B0H64DRAFT_343955 [Chaetomium fimeti]|uniref:Uncharacterized protein n=1 Tax=Chaetomium fimeti TaxID=1854472 RepID=A0AAE0HDL1_9PEZI|nr:hypothetical protein B0H64DRAFT_343955 [Chaetomium fimeti]
MVSRESLTRPTNCIALLDPPFSPTCSIGTYLPRGKEMMASSGTSFPSYHALAPPEHHGQKVELQSSHPSSDADPASPIFAGVELSWRPFYLRRRILFPFAAIFSLVIAATETLLAVSDKNNGIASASFGQHYLWVYTPTAALTLIAAVWGRIEYQSKLVAPWIRLSKQPSNGKRTLLLDYISDFQLCVVFKALRNRDFTVSIVSTVSMMIRAMIVISTGLTTLSWTQVHHQSWPMMLQDRFVDSSSRLTNPGDLAPYIIRGLQEYNLTYPDGLSDIYAFQSARADLPDIAETRVTVDGFENSLECKTAELSLVSSRVAGNSPPRTINLAIASSDCNVEHLELGAPGMRVPLALSCLSSGSCTLLFARFIQIQCDGTTGDPGRRALAVFGNITYSVDPSKDEMDGLRYQARLHRSTQLLCVPTYKITKVDVARNGTQTLNVTASPGSTVRNLHSVTAWNIMQSHLFAYACEHGCSGNLTVTGVYVPPTDPMSIAIPSYITTIGPVDSLFDAGLLQQLVTSYYRQFTAIIAKHLLMEPASIDTSGSVVTHENRRIVQNWAAQWMVGLAAACLGFTALTMFFVPRCGILPCDPTTLPQVALLVSRSHGLLATLCFSGAADTNHLSHHLQNSTFESGAVLDPISTQPHFAVLDIRDPSEEPQPLRQVDLRQKHPYVLHPASRLALCILLAALISILELTLRQSNSNDGIRDVGDNIYIHYTWTVIPALLLGALSLVVSTVDFHTRSLAPYVTLKRLITAREFLALDFMNMSTPRTILREIQGRNLGALGGTLAFLVAAVLTIPSTSLFQPLTIPITTPAILRATKSFPIHLYVANYGNMLASLILEGNLSYPRLTYSDLAFAQLAFTPSSLVDDRYINISSVSVVADVPAVRSKLICRTYNTSSIHTNLALNDTDPRDGTTPLDIYIEGEQCGVETSRGMIYYRNRFPTFPSMTYFGVATPELFGCSDLLYVWGRLEFSKNPIIQHISALGCNESFEALSVSTTFIGPTLDIDTHHPPQPLEHTAHPSTTIFRASSIYTDLAWTNTDPHYLTPFFAMLTSSPWAIPVPLLGDPSATTTIINAIRQQHGIIQAQNLVQQLIPANTTNTTIPQGYPPGTTDDIPLYNATITSAPGSGRRRVVQDTTSTRILQGLLAIILVLLLVNWACMPNTDVLPRSPTTIASAVALLAGGNLLEEGMAGFGPLKGSDGDSGMGGLDGRAGLLRVLLAGKGVGGGGVDGDGSGDDDSVYLKKKEELLKGARFWMGWGTVPDVEGRKVGGGENEGGASRFGIHVVWQQEVEEGWEKKGWKRRKDGGRECTEYRALDTWEG